jgi:hypothetical protein
MTSDPDEATASSITDGSILEDRQEHDPRIHADKKYKQEDPSFVCLSVNKGKLAHAPLTVSSPSSQTMQDTWSGTNPFDSGVGGWAATAIKGIDSTDRYLPQRCPR